MRIESLSWFAYVVASATACDSNHSGDVRATRIGQLAETPVPRVRYDKLVSNACAAPKGMALVAMQRAPYVQRTRSDGVDLLWTSTGDVAYSVEVTLPSGEHVGTFASRVEPTQILRATTQHVAELSGLRPGTLYCYGLRTLGGKLVPQGGLRTAPAPGIGATVSFVAFGDSGDGSSDQTAVFEQIKMVPFDLVLITGDVAYPVGALSAYEQNFFSIYREMLRAIPVFPVAGNHDYETDDAAPFREVFALPANGRVNGSQEGLERWYSFDWGDVHFVAVDTERIGQAQADWLHADLTGNELPWTIVFMHRSPYSSGEHGSSQEVRDWLAPLFELHRVPLVLAGHDHDYERTQVIRGVTYVVTGGGGRGTREVGRSSFTAFSHAVLHFLYVTIEDDYMRLHAIDATGQNFDFVRIRRTSE